MTWRGHTVVKEDAQGFDLDAGHSLVDGSIELILGGSISGRITGTGGEALVDARVELFNPGGNQLVWFATDSQGRYSAAGLYPGTYLVNLSGPGGSSWIDTWWQDGAKLAEATEVAIQPGTVVTGVDAQLAAPSTISGRLVDRDGNGVSGLNVHAWRRASDGAWDPSGSRTTEATGRFTIYGLRAGTYRLQISPSFYDSRGFAHQWWDRTSSESGARSVSVSAETEVQLGDMALLKQIPDLGEWALNGRTPAVDETLFAATAITPSDPPQAVFRWARDGVAIADESSDNYVVRPTDVGTRICAWEDLSGPDLVPQTRSLGCTEPVRRATFEPTGAARLGGIPAAGSTLQVFDAEDEWNPEPTEITYQWRRDGVALSGQNSASYLVSQADYGSQLSVVVAASRPGYESAEKVFAADAVCYPDAAVSGISVGGTRSVGSALSVSGGPADTKMTTSYQWWADGRLLAGADGPSLTLSNQLLGKRVVPTAIGTMNGCPSINRAAIGIAPKTALAATPKISGKAKVGSTLRVTRGSWTSKTSFSYRWYANGRSISKATRSSLKIGRALRGKVITVAVTGKKSSYATITKTSAATSKVR